MELFKILRKVTFQNIAYIQINFQGVKDKRRLYNVSALLLENSWKLTLTCFHHFIANLQWRFQLVLKLSYWLEDFPCTQFLVLFHIERTWTTVYLKLFLKIYLNSPCYCYFIIRTWRRSHQKTFPGHLHPLTSSVLREAPSRLS